MADNAVRRVVATFNVPEGFDANDVAEWIQAAIVDIFHAEPHPQVVVTYDLVDSTVWEWPDFWADVAEGVVGPHIDTTTKEGAREQ